MTFRNKFYSCTFSI